MREIRNECYVLVEKSEGKRSRGRPRRRWEGNIRIDLSEMKVGRYRVNSSGSGYGLVGGGGGVVNTVVNFRIP
jgi:hypothetical protein